MIVVLDDVAICFHLDEAVDLLHYLFLFQGFQVAIGDYFYCDLFLVFLSDGVEDWVLAEADLLLELVLLDHQCICIIFIFQIYNSLNISCFYRIFLKKHDRKIMKISRCLQTSSFVSALLIESSKADSYVYCSPSKCNS